MSSVIRLAKSLFYWLVPRSVLARRFPASRKVFLTFDDGPHPLNTERILRTLAAHGAKATFFMTGIQVKKYPEIAREVAAQGHEVASHSWFHQRNPHFEMRAMEQEIVTTEETLHKTCGVVTRTFRPPYGRLTFALLWHAVRRRMPVVLWSVDSSDDRGQSPAIIAENCRRAGPGDVVLFHDDNWAVLEALPGVLAEMKARGLGFGTVREGLRGAEPAAAPAPAAAEAAAHG
jgi:peptidoglycan-N-acetylglucosamine deacetylase